MEEILVALAIMAAIAAIKAMEEALIEWMSEPRFTVVPDTTSQNN